MKHESLKSSKFGIFKDDILNNPLLVVGGLVESTTWTSYNSEWQVTGSGSDTWYTGPDIPQGCPISTHWNTQGDMQKPIAGGGGEEEPFIEDPLYTYDYRL